MQTPGFQSHAPHSRSEAFVALRRESDLQHAALARGLYLNDAPSVVAFTGSGGKTTCCDQLAQDAALDGQRVVLTTTTKIRVPAEHIDAHTTTEVRHALVRGPLPVVIGTVAPDGKKLSGPPLALLEALSSEGVADLIVIEADGSRGASVKGYRGSEPVFPSHVDRVCVVVGVDAIGAGRDTELVHRPEILWPLLELPDNARLSAQDVAQAILLQPAYLSRRPSVVLVNKVDDDAAVQNADALLAALAPRLPARGVVRVLLRGRAVGNVACAWQRPARKNIAAVVLAAGLSSRFGGLKQLAKLDGMPLAQHAVLNLLKTSVSSVIVVLGHEAGAVRAAMDVNDSRLRFVQNPDYRHGMATSIAAGVGAAGDADGVLVALADMPRVSPNTIETLLNVFRETPFDLVAPTHEGRRGHPVLFDRRFIVGLGRLHGDAGAAALLREHAADLLTVPSDGGVLMDVDEPFRS